MSPPTTTLPSVQPAPRIALFGMFGQGNLGNEATLQALVLGLRARLPSASLLCVCSDPADVSKRHGLDAVAAVPPKRARVAGRIVTALERSPRPLRLALLRGPQFASECRRAFAALRGCDMFVVAGTGVLEDNSGWSVGWLAHLFKWLVAARLRGAKVVFQSVGAGPLHGAAATALVKASLGLADAVSFRDVWSLDYMRSVGFDAACSTIAPDLVFGMPTFPRPEAKAGRPATIGVGVMDYFGQRTVRRPDPAVHDAYLRKTVELIGWLLQQGHRVCLIYGDARYDPAVLGRVRALVVADPMTRGAEIAAVDVNEVEALIDALAKLDAIVSPRFHNLVFGLMLGKPVISLSYHPKNDALLASFGLHAYTQDIDTLDVGLFRQQFASLWERRDELSRHSLERAAVLRGQMDAEYRLLIELLPEPWGTRRARPRRMRWSARLGGADRR